MIGTERLAEMRLVEGAGHAAPHQISQIVADRVARRDSCQMLRDDVYETTAIAAIQDEHGYHAAPQVVFRRFAHPWCIATLRLPPHR
jgi:hypothetical protein